MRQWIAWSGVVAAVSVAVAQSVVVTEYTIRVLDVATQALVVQVTAPSLAVRCGLEKRQTVDPLITNPRAIRWDDPNDDTKDCEYGDLGTGALFNALVTPGKTYVVSVRPTYDSGIGSFARSDNAFRRERVKAGDPVSNIRVVK